MTDEIKIVSTEPTEEEKLISIQKARVDLKESEADLEKKLLELENLKYESITLMKEGFEMLNLRTARLSGGVDSDTVAQARTELYMLSERFPGEQLILDINSPGGSVSAGMELYGIIRELSKSGHHMVTRISGEAASMGGIIAQAGDTRQIREGSYLHLHEAGWGAAGKASEMMEAAEFIEKISKDIAKIYAKKSRMSADQIYNRFHRREWWLDAEEALDVGFVDEIV